MFLQANRISEEALVKVSDCIRSFDGIRVLIDLLNSENKEYSYGADATRALACRALLGLTRNRDILDLLRTLFAHGQVQVDTIFWKLFILHVH